MSMSNRWIAGCVVFLTIATWAACKPAVAGDWSRFRGPNGSGVAVSDRLPFKFGPEQNLRWKIAMPPGHSSPVLAGDRLFLTAFDDEQLQTYCVDRATGSVLWHRQLRRSRAETLDSRNNPASPTPVTDGERVYVFFPDFGLICYDREAIQQWRLPLGPFNNIYGMGASPILAGGKVLLVCDQSIGSFLVAVDKRNGRVAWKVQRPIAKSGHSTPIVYRPPQEVAQVLVPGSFRLTAYSLDAGKPIWWTGGLSFEMKSTPVMDERTVYLNGYGSPWNQPGNQRAVAPFEEVAGKHDADGDGRLAKTELPDRRAQGAFSFVDLDADGFLTADEWTYYRAAMASTNGTLAISLGGHGDTTQTGVRWQNHRAVPQLPSPLLYQAILYLINDTGIATSFDPRTGRVIKRGRLAGAAENFYASPVAADDKIFFVSESGKVAVVSNDGLLHVREINDLGEPCYATPAIAGDTIYLRTQTTLYAFGFKRD